MIILNKQDLTYEKALDQEWIIANHKGGYASSTVIGANTSKYHGLLILAKAPPRDRFLLVSKIEETILLNNKKYELSTNKTNEKITPNGHTLQEQFKLDPFPTFVFKIEDTLIEKKVFMIHSVNASIVRYSISTNVPLTITLTPLVNSREIHNINNSTIDFKQTESSHGTKIMSPDFNLYLDSDNACYIKNEKWFKNMTYDMEKKQAGNSENHFIPGQFTTEIKGKETFHIGMGDLFLGNDFNAYYAAELERNSKLLNTFYTVNKVARTDFLDELILASDSFIVEDKNYYSIIAGYPYYTDWGRDTMIALPGLLLATGRDKEARSILDKYATYCRNGLIPHFISEKREPDYGSIDTALFYIYAIYEFYKCKNDNTLIRDKLWNPIKSVIENYENGIEGKVHMDKDGLLVIEGNSLAAWNSSIGSATSTQNAKLVYVNVLWYNALKIAEYFAEKVNDTQMEEKAANLSELVKQNFAKFWDDSSDCLFDAIEPNDSRISFSQLFAISLDFQLIDNQKSRKIVEKILKELYTPLGLKDSQGRIAVWPLGHLVTAYLKIYGKQEEAKSILDLFINQTKKSNLGTIPELYSGKPLKPEGCVSFATSTAEVLRGYLKAHQE